MHIYVKTLTGKTLDLDVESEDTVADLKTNIKKKEGIPPDQGMRLIIHGKQLADGSTLAENEINDESTLFMVLAPCNRKSLQINVKRLTGKMFTIEVGTQDTIQNVKLTIQEKEGLPPEQQRLIYGGKLLDDTCMISKYNIESEATIHLVMRCSQNGGQQEGPKPVDGKCEENGACGLINLGNTCFMNSTLQALSNTVSLRKYYRCGDFKQDISTAPPSMSGRLANGFADLLEMMWDGRHTAVPPTDFKRLIAERCPEFGGHQQHDAQEVLTFLLDGLHEDANRAPYPRPIVNDPSTDGKSEAEVAAEAWSGNLQRNNSTITERFQFQIRSDITFPDVNDRSFKFDPMMYLSLPVPKPPHTAHVTVLPLGYPEVAPSNCNFQIPKNHTFKDLEAKVSEATPPTTGLGKPRCFVFAMVFNHRVYKLLGKNQRIGEVHAGNVWAFEVALESDMAEEEHEFVAVNFRRPQKSANTSAVFNCFAPPHIFAIQPGSTTNADVSHNVDALVNHITHFTGSSAPQVSLTMVAMYSGEEGEALSSVGNFQLTEGKMLALNFMDLDAEVTLPEPSAVTNQNTTNSSDLDVHLTQCLDAFTRCEELAQEDWVKSERTRASERSLKKLDIWSAPECLVIHLKRFGCEQLGGPIEKIDTLVNAPLQLDLLPWIQGPSPEQGAQYRLYAVVNHSGSPGFGHYTAYARVGDGPDRQWYHFNDSLVTRVDESEVVSKSAYILFYERLGCN